jgi:3-phenylpropionate/trans-cinnamate dioxygenase ferredoxin subunit
VSAAYKVARAADIAPGETHRVRANGAIIAIYNVDGTFYATDDTCTHEEASLSDGWLEDTEITCPLHGATFDVTTGAVLTLPATKPLRTYAVRLEGDDIYIEV